MPLHRTPPSPNDALSGGSKAAAAQLRLANVSLRATTDRHRKEMA